MLDCWKEEPKERPNFSKLVSTISLNLPGEAAEGHMDLANIKTEQLVSAEMVVKTRTDGSRAQSPSGKGWAIGNSCVANAMHRT